MWEIFSPYFNVYFVYFKNLQCFQEGKRHPLPGHIFQFCKYPKLGLDLHSVIFHWKWGGGGGGGGGEGPSFSVLSYSWVRFSRYSVSEDEPFACETAESFRSGLATLMTLFEPSFSSSSCKNWNCNIVWSMNSHTHCYQKKYPTNLRNK